MIECVMNLSEGRRLELVAELAMLAGNDLLDVHSDPHHHRSVFTLVGADAARTVARHAIEVLDLRDHQGVHPRLGSVDVVPFVPLEDSTMDEAIAERDAFARWAADELAVPCFLYGPRIAGAGGALVDRTLPELRRLAWAGLPPDFGPTAPHHRAGAMCVGARPVLVAYNVWLAAGDLAAARRIAQAVRSPEIRALALPVGARLQVSLNLVDPERVGPADAYDRVTELATAHSMDVVGAELVGLVPARALARIPKHRWSELDLASERTIEWQLAARNRRR